MSAPLAGKFQDHYEVLGVEPMAPSDVIQRTYEKLADQYNPAKSVVGDQEKFDAVTHAYEVLSNPVLRHEFNKLKGIGEKESLPRFSGAEFFNALGRQKALRAALLCLLYDRRRLRPFTPSLSMRHMEAMLDATIEELTFVVWYLKQRGHAAADDKSSLQITVEGMDFLELDMPPVDLVMPMVRPGALIEQPKAALAAKPEAEAEAEPAAAKVEPAAYTAELPKAPRAEESVMKVLSRNIARNKAEAARR